MLNKIYFLLLITVSFAFFSCSAKLPSPQEKGKGIVAIPLNIKDTSHVGNIARDYILKDYKKQDVEIFIHPRIGQKFVFSQPLKPGEYQLYWVTSKVNNHEVYANKWTTSKNLPKSIYFNIEEGSITVADKIFSINQFSTSDTSFVTKHYVDFLGREKRKQMIAYLKTKENSKLWKFTN